jgi:hypothetical protein
MVCARNREARWTEVEARAFIHDYARELAGIAREAKLDRIAFLLDMLLVATSKEKLPGGEPPDKINDQPPNLRIGDARKVRN